MLLPSSPRVLVSCRWCLRRVHLITIWVVTFYTFSVRPTHSLDLCLGCGVLPCGRCCIPYLTPFNHHMGGLPCLVPDARAKPPKPKTLQTACCSHVNLWWQCRFCALRTAVQSQKSAQDPCLILYMSNVVMGRAAAVAVQPHIRRRLCDLSPDF